MTKTMSKHPFYKEVLKRVYKKRQNVLILIVGDVGTGKSILALRLAERLDPNFNRDIVRERVIVQPEQFSELVAEKGENRLPEGSVVIIDEAGASAMSSRDWYSIGNKMISRILQTFRYRRLILIMTVPNMSFIDVHARKLINFLIQTKKIDFSTNKTKAHCWSIDYNKISGAGEPYRTRFRKRDKYGEIVTLDHMWFKKPNIKLVHAYEKYSYEFKQTIIEKSMTNIQKINAKAEKKKEFDPKEVAEKVLANRDRYFKENGEVNIHMIQVDFKVGSPRARNVKALVQTMEKV